MPFWPFFMGTAFLLTLAGWRHGVWHIPALAFAGYVGMRGVMTWVPANAHEVAACTLWLIVAGIMMYRGGYVPGFFYALSALTYPALLPFGFRLDYLGLSPIIAEAFAVFALLSIGGGIVGMVHPNLDRRGFLAWFSVNSLGVAAREKVSDKPI